MTRDEIERLLERRLTAWQDRDPSTLAADHAIDGVVESPTHGRLRTPDAIREVYATWFEAFPDIQFSHDDILIDGDRAAVSFRAKGTHIKPFGAVPATGRPMEIRGVLVYTFREGRIVHERRYYDSTSLLVQLGVIKAKPM